jgi:hypothetical protein
MLIYLSSYILVNIFVEYLRKRILGIKECERLIVAEKEGFQETLV